MKKILFVVILIALLSVGTVFADHPKGFGIGVVGGYGLGGVNGGLGLNFPKLPIFWVVDLGGFIDDSGNGYSNVVINVRGDYYIIDKDLVDKWLGWYLGIGAYAGIGISKSYSGFGAGVRVPIGLSLQPIPLLEVFLEIAPRIGFWIDSNRFGLGTNFFGGALGVKLWF